MLCRFLYLLFLVLGMATPGHTAEKPILTFGFNDASAYPYLAGTGSELADPPGLSVELVRHVAELLNIQPVFVRMPGMRVLHTLKTGHVDAAFLFSYRKEREEFGLYPMRNGLPDGASRLATLSYLLYKPKGRAINWDGQRFRDFSGRVGANLNYSVVADLRQMGIEVIEGRSTEMTFRMLLAGRVEAVADQEVVADAHLANIDAPHIEKVTPPLSRKDYFLLFSHQFMDRHGDLARLIWKTLSEERDSFTASIAHRYAGEDGR